MKTRYVNRIFALIALFVFLISSALAQRNQTFDYDIIIKNGKVYDGSLNPAFKAINYRNWGKVKDACQIIEAAQARGLKVTADQYPYPFSNGNPYITLIPDTTWIGNNEDDLLKTKDIQEIFDYLRDDHLIALYNKVSTNSLISPGHEQYLQNLSRKELVRLVSREIVNLRDFHGVANYKERYLFMERLKDPTEAQQILDEVREHVTTAVPPEFIIIAMCVEKALEGKSLAEAAEIKGKSIEGTAIELALMGTLAVPMKMSEQDIEFAMKKDWVATGSDGGAPFFGIVLTHIRSYSTFLHKIKKYMMGQKAISLEHAILSQTSLAAQIMNRDDRGWIKEGYKADIVILDLKN